MGKYTGKQPNPEDIPFGETNAWVRTLRPEVSNSELQRKKEEEHVRPDVSKEIPGPLLGIAIADGEEKDPPFSVGDTSQLQQNAGRLMVVKARIIEQDRVPHPDEDIKYEDGQPIGTSVMEAMYDEFVGDKEGLDKPNKGDYVLVDYDNRLTRSGPKYFGLKYRGTANGGASKGKDSPSTAQSPQAGLQSTTTPPSGGSPVPGTTTPVTFSTSTGFAESTSKEKQPNPRDLQSFTPVPNPLARGVDYSGRPPPVADLSSAGYSFVMRYVPYGTWKDLKRPELDSLLAAGLSVGFVFQRFGSEFEATEREVRQLGITLGDAKAAGRAMAKLAKKGMKKLGLPETVPIYFAIEAGGGTRDVADNELDKIRNYFKGIIEEVGSVSRVGMYGGDKAMFAVQAAGLASYFWQSRGWTRPIGNVRKPLYPFSNILQCGMGQVAGTSVDFNYLLKQDSGLIKK